MRSLFLFILFAAALPGCWSTRDLGEFAGEFAYLIRVDNNTPIGSGRVVTVSNASSYRVEAWPDRHEGVLPRPIRIFEVAPGGHVRYDTYKNWGRDRIETTTLLKAYNKEGVQVGQAKLNFNVPTRGIKSSVFVLCDHIFDRRVYTHANHTCASVVRDY